MNNRSHSRRRGGVLGVLTLALAFVALSAAPAGAVGENGGAFGLSANGIVDISPTPDAQCPGTSNPDDVANATVGNLLTANVLEAECTSGNAPGGPVTASARAASVTVGALNGLTVDALSTSCQTSATGATTHSSVVTINDREILTNETFQLQVESGLANVYVNEVKEENGFVVVNALRVQVLPTQGGGSLQDVTVAQSRCRQGGVIPEVPLALVLPLSAVGIFGAAFLIWRRRPGLAA